jgi:hypothetical protein
VERRRDRERAEEDLRRAKVRSLDGSADFDEVSEFASALDAAREEEAKAREVLAFLGADVRVRVPQPLGKPIAEVVEEERRVSREIERRRRGARGARRAATSRPATTRSLRGGAGALRTALRTVFRTVRRLRRTRARRRGG